MNYVIIGLVLIILIIEIINLTKKSKNADNSQIEDIVRKVTKEIISTHKEFNKEI